MSQTLFPRTQAIVQWRAAAHYASELKNDPYTSKQWVHDAYLEHTHDSAIQVYAEELLPAILGGPWMPTDRPITEGTGESFRGHRIREWVGQGYRR